MTTRLQTSARKKTSGAQALIDAIKSIIRTEGVFGFYRGLASDSISTGLSNLIFFAAYSWLHDRLLLRKTAKSAKHVTGSGSAGSKASPTAALSAVEGIVVGCLVCGGGEKSTIKWTGEC